MPQSGIISDQHPFSIGHGGLSLSQNWWNHDGEFRTRDGLISMAPAKRWYERLEFSNNLIPTTVASGDSSGTIQLVYNGAYVTVASGTDDAIVGDHQYTATVPSDPGENDTDVTLPGIVASPGLPYTAWVFSDSGTVAGDIKLEFFDNTQALIEAHDLIGDPILNGIRSVTATSPPTTAEARMRFKPTFGHPVVFGPMKLVQGEEVEAWTPGYGSAAAHDENLLPISVAHPETTEEAIAMWEPIHGKEELISLQNNEVQGLFTGYSQMAIVGRALAYAAQPTKFLPSYIERTGVELKGDYRFSVAAGSPHNLSISYYFDVEVGPIPEMVYAIEAVYYNGSDVEIGYTVIASANVQEIGGELSLTTVRGRAEEIVTPVGLTESMGIRVRCDCPTAIREIVYDNDENPVYDNDGVIVTIENENLKTRRLGIVLEDIKLVMLAGSGTRWWDFELPVVEHAGLLENGEYPLNFYPHDYLFEGAPEANRIVMASDQSLWKWDDTTDEWVWIGFDLSTIYSAFYLSGTDEDDEETLTLDERIAFEETDPEGYTSEPSEPDELEIQITLPAAAEGSENPVPGGWWKYKVNDQDWSGKHSLTVEPPVTEADIVLGARTLDVRIKIEDIDFDDVCVTPEGEDPENPIFKARIFTRRHDGEDGETLFNTDRDAPVDMRGYDYSQKTYIVCANSNDRVTAWDGQLENKMERAGSNAPFAKTICVSGGRILAGNVKFDDPYTDLVAPLAVVYTDTFLSRGFRNWHPELAIRLADTPGEIVKLLEMGTLAVAAYKTDAAHMLVYQTGNNPFRQQLMASNIAGPVSVRAVAALTENSHMYLGEDGGIYVFDGSYPRNFSLNISRTIQYELDLAYKDRAFLAYTPRLNAVLAMYPTVGSDGRVNRGMWIDIDQQAGWPFEWNGPLFDFTAGAPVQTLSKYKMSGVTIRLGSVTSAIAGGETLQPDFFIGTADGSTYVIDENALDDWGTPVRALMRSGLTEFGLLDKYSVLKEMEFVINRTNSPHIMNVEVWSADHGTDAKPVSHAALDIFEDGPYQAEVREKARFWGYGLEIFASEHIFVSGAYGAVRQLGYRKS